MYVAIVATTPVLPLGEVASSRSYYTMIRRHDEVVLLARLASLVITVESVVSQKQEALFSCFCFYIFIKLIIVHCYTVDLAAKTITLLGATCLSTVINRSLCKMFRLILKKLTRIKLIVYSGKLFKNQSKHFPK
jgi:hypothetical protein